MVFISNLQLKIKRLNLWMPLIRSIIISYNTIFHIRSINELILLQKNLESYFQQMKQQLLIEYFYRYWR